MKHPYISFKAGGQINFPVMFMLFMGFTLTNIQCVNNRTSSLQLPENWCQAGSDFASYEMGIDENNGGKRIVSLRSLSPMADSSEYGALMQNIKAEKFAGKRISLKGFLKTSNVAYWAGLWIRVNWIDSNRPGSIENSHEKTLGAWTEYKKPDAGEWKQYDIVMDIPEDAGSISFGASLNGTGHVWIDRLKLEIVDKNTPLAGIEMASDQASCEGAGKPEDTPDVQHLTEFQLRDAYIARRGTNCCVPAGEPICALLPEPANLSFEK